MPDPKMLFVGPLRDFSGYAAASRNYVEALDSLGCDIVTRYLNYDGAKFELPDKMLQLENKSLQNINIVVQQTTPNETERKEGLFNVNIFCWETDRIPPEWVVQLNLMDLVIVSCEENMKACRVSGVIVPIEVVPFAFNPEKYKEKNAPYHLQGSELTFKMLTVCQISKKKGIDALLRAYFSEFTPEDNTLLILKVYNSTNDTEENKKMSAGVVNQIRSLMRLNRYPKVWLIHDLMTDSGINRLYSTADAYVLPSRGEGWSITHFESMAYGLPPIATGWGGPTEFITDKEGWLVDYHMSPCFDMNHPHPFMYTAKDNWPEPHIDSLKKSMREAHIEWKMHKVEHRNSRWNERVQNCINRVNDFSYEKVGPMLRDAIFKHYNRWKVNSG
jgi:glycosyltransferase involved in cell wall biosynthesis